MKVAQNLMIFCVEWYFDFTFFWWFSSSMSMEVRWEIDFDWLWFFGRNLVSRECCRWCSCCFLGLGSNTGVLDAWLWEFFNQNLVFSSFSTPKFKNFLNHRGVIKGFFTKKAENRPQITEFPPFQCSKNPIKRHFQQIPRMISLKPISIPFSETN